MASSKLKLTGFARFFLFLILVVPSIYMGVTYYKGENGIENIKNYLGMGDETTKETEVTDFPSTNSNDVKTLQDALKAAEKENAQLKAELSEVKTQLKQIKALINNNGEN